MNDPDAVRSVLFITWAPVLLSFEYMYTVSFPKLFIAAILLTTLFPAESAPFSTRIPKELSPMEIFDPACAVTV